MDKFVQRNKIPHVEFRGIKNICRRELEVPRVVVGLDGKGNPVTYVPESVEAERFRVFWADVERFGTVKRTGTLEEFFRQRQAARE